MKPLQKRAIFWVSLVPYAAWILFFLASLLFVALPGTAVIATGFLMIVSILPVINVVWVSLHCIGCAIRKQFQAFLLIPLGLALLSLGFEFVYALAFDSFF